MANAHGEKFCLRWNDFENNISSAFRELREDKDFFDVTLACEDNQLQAHKVILSACSPFFRSVLKRNPHQHPLLYLKGVSYNSVLAVLNFMYHGEVNVAQEELNSFLAVAEELKVKGLTQNEQQGVSRVENRNISPPVVNKRTIDTPIVPAQPSPVPFKQQKIKPQLNSIGGGYEVDRGVEQVANIKTEVPVLVDMEDEEEQHQEGQLVGTTQEQEQEEYGAEENYDYGQGYGTMQGFDNQPVMGDTSTDDPYSHMRQYVEKVVHGNGFNCTLCGKHGRDMYLMREHMESCHSLSPGYFCRLCSQHCKNHKCWKTHMKKNHPNGV